MFKRLSLQSGKSKQNTRKLWGRQHKASQPASAASLSSFLKRVITDAEQIATSIKMKAQTEAEAEAGRIISQARQEAEEIRRKAEIATQKEAAVSESMEAATLQEEVAEEEVKQPAQLQKEAAISEPVGMTTGEPSEQPIREERPARVAARPTSLKQDSQTLYTGEVELAISVPVDLKMVSKLYNHLQTTPELKIIHTAGTWDRGTTITVMLDKPMPLISLISKIGGIEAIPELPEKDGPGKENLSSLMGKKKGGAKRIRLTPK